MKKILISLTEENQENLKKLQEWREKKFGYKESRSAIINKIIKEYMIP